MEFIESFMKFSFSDDDIFRIEDDELVKDVENIKAISSIGYWDFWMHYVRN